MSQAISNQKTLNNGLEIVHDRQPLNPTELQPAFKEFVSIRYGRETLLAGPLEMLPNADHTAAVPTAQLDIKSGNNILTIGMYKDAFDAVKEMTGHTVSLSVYNPEKKEAIEIENMKCIYKRSLQACKL